MSLLGFVLLLRPTLLEERLIVLVDVIVHKRLVEVADAFRFLMASLPCRLLGLDRGVCQDVFG